MNEVFLMGKIISDIKFDFIINDKKKKAIVKFEIKTLNNESIYLVAYNDIADYVYRKCKKNDEVFIFGSLLENKVLIEEIKLFIKRKNI